MILQNFTFPGVITLPDKIPFPPEKTAFLDLETKAIGRKNSRILYLGLIFQENGTWQVRQWLPEQTEEEKEMLHYYELDDKYEEVREWYDGYHMGEIDVYCPWDVMNYILELQYNPKAEPQSYWKNTSDNAIIRSFIDCSGSNITRKLEALMSGGHIFQHIDEYLTYDYLHSSEENFWSILY